MTNNPKLLARIVAHQAVQRAGRAHLSSPQERVMEALSEAIESKRNTETNHERKIGQCA